jgi:hypothetical protein
MKRSRRKHCNPDDIADDIARSQHNLPETGFTLKFIDTYIGKN